MNVNVKFNSARIQLKISITCAGFAKVANNSFQLFTSLIPDTSIPPLFIRSCYNNVHQSDWTFV